MNGVADNVQVRRWMCKGSRGFGNGGRIKLLTETPVRAAGTAKIVFYLIF